MKNNFFRAHIHQNFSFNGIYWAHVLALIPSLLGAFWLNNEFTEKILILFAVILIQELFFYLTKTSPVYWGFSALTGIYLAFLLPLNLPLLAFILTPVLSLGLLRYLFGFSAYWLSPSLTGFLFAFSIWPHTWLQLLPNQGSACLLNTYLTAYPLAEGAQFLADLINHSPLFEGLFINVPSAYLSLLEGSLLYNFISPLWIYLALVILWRRHIIKWTLSLSFFISYFFLLYVFEGVLFEQGNFFSGDLFFYFLSPVTLISIFFISTENQTSPLNKIDMLLQGAINGLFSFLILFIWLSPWSILFGIILAQICCPLFELHKVAYYLNRKKMERSLNLPFFSQNNKDGET